MTTALEQIQQEIVQLEARLKLLRTAETALLELNMVPPVSMTYKESDRLSLPEKWRPAAEYIHETPAKGLAAAIRSLLAEAGPKTKADIDKALSEDFSMRLGKGSVSGALQAMKVRGIVTRTKAGKWTVK
jgi:hypothetical protein